MKNFSTKWRKKKLLISIVSVLVTATILFGAFAYVFYYETVIPYSDNLVKIETQNDHQLVSHYFGKSYAGVHVTHPTTLEVDGQEYIFELSESEKIDAVYYAEFDVEKITAGKDSWDSILEGAVLIWEK